MGAHSWALLLAGVAVGVALMAVSGAVRDAVLDVVAAVAGWWWELVATVRRVVEWTALLVLVSLASWAFVALLLPRLAEK